MFEKTNLYQILIIGHIYILFFFTIKPNDKQTIHLM